MSFKERRDLVKESTVGRGDNDATQRKVDGLSRRSAPSSTGRTQGGMTNLKETRNKVRTGNESENQALSA